MRNRVLLVAALSAACALSGCQERSTDATGFQIGDLLEALPRPQVTSLMSEPSHVLFVGNSYLYYGDSVHNHVRRMAQEAGFEPGSGFVYKSATIGGAALFDHNIEHLVNHENLRVDRPFEVVVLQGGSAAALSEERRRLFRDTALQYAGIIDEASGQTALYMTHAYVEPHERYQPGMIADIASLYIETGNEIGALVIPVGLAFEEAYRRRPEIELHKDFDGTHPDLAGTLLASFTVFASLYGASPTGNPYDYFGEVDADTLQFLQSVAHDTVSNFYGRPLTMGPDQ
jgi:hypothetical protein